MQFPDTPATRLTNQVMMRYREINPEIPVSEFNAQFTRLWTRLDEVGEGEQINLTEVPEEIQQILNEVVKQEFEKLVNESAWENFSRSGKILRVLTGPTGSGGGEKYLGASGPAYPGARHVRPQKGPRHTPPKKRRK